MIVEWKSIVPLHIINKDNFVCETMKICLITKECFPFYYGGIGSAFYALGCMLSGMGHEVVLLTKKPANLEEQSLNAYYRSNFSVEWVPYHQSEYSPHFAYRQELQGCRHECACAIVS